VDAFSRFAEAFVSIFADAGIWLVVGFLVAGLLHAFLSRDLLVKHLGKKGIGSVLKATLIGVPLPLCSCSVIPAAASIRQGGASKGASAAFVVSTPEIDVPAASLTWAMLGPVMAIARVIAAATSAIVAGVLIDMTDKAKTETQPARIAPTTKESSEVCCGSSQSGTATSTFGDRLKVAFGYAFVTLPADLVNWLMIGFVVSAAVGAFVPESWFAGSLGSGVVAISVAMVFGLVVYVCATGSTPMAAALVAKGLGPGAALAFLLAGPATNPATMAWVLKDLGGKALAVYLVSIAGVALVSGLALEWFLAGSAFDSANSPAHSMASTSQVASIGGALLMAMMAYAIVRKFQLRFESKNVRGQSSCGSTSESDKACCNSKAKTEKPGCCS
jgi:uncharacterized membrane protein YraQ (UPF0718 family)